MKLPNANAIASFVALAVAVPAFGGSLGGSKAGHHTVQAQSTDQFVVMFQSGEIARIGVIGDGDTDLDLYVYDEYGNSISSDTDDTDNCIVSWVPSWTGAYTIRVVNLGSVHNNYWIGTN